MDVVSKNAEMQENTELVKKVEMEDTPFTIVELEGRFFGTMGNYRLTEQFDSFEECEEVMKEFSWNRVIQVMMLLVDKLKDTDLEKLIKEN